MYVSYIYVFWMIIDNRMEKVMMCIRMYCNVVLYIHTYIDLYALGGEKEKDKKYKKSGRSERKRKEKKKKKKKRRLVREKFFRAVEGGG